MTLKRYGDLLKPLDIAALLDVIEERNDPSVVRFIELVDRTQRAEMISDPNTWTSAEQSAWEKEDWRQFSKLRGYTESEIAEFAEYIELARALDIKYGEHYSESICYLVQKQVGALDM